MTTIFEDPPAVKAARRSDHPEQRRLRVVARRVGGAPGVAACSCC